MGEDDYLPELKRIGSVTLNVKNISRLEHLKDDALEDQIDVLLRKRLNELHDKLLESEPLPAWAHKCLVENLSDLYI